MLQIRSIVLRGQGVNDAVVSFVDGSNVLAGPSDTGKSYLVRCLDYIFGAEEMSKRIPKAEPYSQLFVEFENSEKKLLSLERSLSGGDLAAYQVGIADIDGQQGEKIVASRSGMSKAKDVTSVLFEFAKVNEARLRKDARGGTQRLTIRTLLPMFLVDEVAAIDERSPILGRSGFSDTPHKRAFAYMLTGKDDAGIIATERREIQSTRLNAQLAIISDLLSPIEERLQKSPPSEESVEKVDEAIAALSKSLADHSVERESLETERREALAKLRRAESQVVAIDELITQYKLLEDRYRTDLERLDFIAEGAHFFEGLQEVRCPLCDQLMSPDHAHGTAERRESVYLSAKAEAAKILALRTDLMSATASLTERLALRRSERQESDSTIKRIDTRISSFLAPAMQEASQQINRFMKRLLDLEAARSDEAQASSLMQMKEQIEGAGAAGRVNSSKWEPLPSQTLRKFCVEVEAVLRDWNWKGEGRVEFDDSTYDIIVDGQTRQSHGKGVRAILYSAFVISLLRYCHANQRPHLGFVVIDSPLTSYRKGKDGGAADEPISEDLEAGFWRSLTTYKLGAQLIIIENKEPPSEVAAAVHYEWFAGGNAALGERGGFIP
jgi:hypothetical protein